MSKQHPRIEAQREILRRLFELDFSHSEDEYTGDFLPGDADTWAPRFHYHQGIEHFRMEINHLWRELEDEYDKWKESHK